MTEFKDLDLAKPILQNITYKNPTPIQEQAIPLILEGHDLLGIAQTGTGKTAAFCLPLLNSLYKSRNKRVSKCPRALILTPTRELAIQIHENLEKYGQGLNQNYAVIFGGVGQGKQVRALQKGVDVLVATPGRLLDLIGQKHLRLDKAEVFVLDEADRMLDMGFLRDIKKVLPLLPKQKHNLFFSATMPPTIQKLAQSILINPKKVEVTPQATTVERINQTAMYTKKSDKLKLLLHLIKNKCDKKTLVFVEMKHVANKVTEKLLKNDIRAAAIHGNKSQGARQRAIQDFASGKVQVLVATDIASRGIDIDGITHVINFQLPNMAESYVHRIGRTARAGANGEAISMVTAEEKSYLVNIEKTTKQKIDVITDHPCHSQEAMDAIPIKASKMKAKIEGQRRGRRGGGSGRGGNSRRNAKTGSRSKKHPPKKSSKS